MYVGPLETTILGGRALFQGQQGLTTLLAPSDLTGALNGYGPNAGRPILGLWWIAKTWKFVGNECLPRFAIYCVTECLIYVKWYNYISSENKVRIMWKKFLSLSTSECSLQNKIRSFKRKFVSNNKKKAIFNRMSKFFSNHHARFFVNEKQFLAFISKAK